MFVYTLPYVQKGMQEIFLVPVPAVFCTTAERERAQVLPAICVSHFHPTLQMSSLFLCVGTIYLNNDIAPEFWSSHWESLGFCRPIDELSHATGFFHYIDATIPLSLYDKPRQCNFIILPANMLLYAVHWLRMGAVHSVAAF
jgi:hypothetical protein